MPRHRVGDTRWLIAALVLAALLRIGFWAAYDGHPLVVITSDTHSYWKTAITLFRHGEFSYYDSPPFAPNVMRTPLYPVFLGACTFLLRQDAPAIYSALTRSETAPAEPALGKSAQPIALVQILISLLALAATWYAGNRAFGPRATALAALLLALDVPTAVCVNSLMTEALFSALLAGALLCAWPILEDPRRRPAPRLIVLGLLLGLLALCRPVALYFFVFLALFFALAVFARGSRLRPTILLTAAALVLPAAWTARNWARVGVPIFCSISAINLYQYRAAWNQARLEGRSYEEVKAEFERKTVEASATEAGRVRFMQREAMRILLAHPGLTARQGLEGAVKMLLGISSSGLDYLWRPRTSWGDSRDLNNPGSIGARAFAWAFGGRPPWIAALKGWSALHLLLVYGGIAWAFARLRRDPALRAPHARPARLFFSLCALTVAYFILVSVGAEANSRFRMPIEPALCLMSGVGWAGLLTRKPPSAAAQG